MAEMLPPASRIGPRGWARRRPSGDDSARDVTRNRMAGEGPGLSSGQLPVADVRTLGASVDNLRAAGERLGVPVTGSQLSLREVTNGPWVARRRFPILVGSIGQVTEPGGKQVTSRSTATIVAGALTVGLLTGAAGAIVVGSATADGAVDRHHEQMGAMMEVTGGADMVAMMEMMGGPMMSEPADMGSGSRQHDAHHPNANR